MKVMAMHKVDAAMEAGTPPSQQVIEGMGALIGEMMQAGVFKAGEGLKESKHRVRLTFKNGERTVERGPYAGRNELVSSFCLLRAANLDEAVEWGTRWAKAHATDVEVELGPVVEEWDLAGAPKPANVTTTRYLALTKDPPPLTAEQRQKVDAVIADMSKARAFISADWLTPGKDATRLIYRRGRKTVIDGPFAESKELIAGFSLLEVANREELMKWAEKFCAVLGDVECDLRPVATR